MGDRMLRAECTETEGSVELASSREKFRHALTAIDRRHSITVVAEERTPQAHNICVLR